MLLIRVCPVNAAIRDSGKVEIIPIFELGEVEVAGRSRYEKDIKYYREPNAIVTKNGTLVVMCGSHNKVAKNDRAHQDLLCRTSKNCGKTWSKTNVVADYDMNSVLPTCLVYDEEKNRIIALINIIYNAPDSTEKRGCQQFVLFSHDEGQTWSEPKEVSGQMKNKGAIHVFGGGNGIQVKKGRHKGRLLVPGGYGGPVMFYSDDHGDTWEISESAGSGRKEATACELSNGDIAMFSRKSDYGIQMAVSRDGGESWKPQEQILPDVWASNNNGSLTLHSKKGETCILFSGPLGPENAGQYALAEQAKSLKRGTADSRQKARSNGAVFASFDDGKTWPKHTLAVPFPAFGYNCMVQLPDGDIGLVFEGARHLSSGGDHNTKAVLGIYMAKFSASELRK